MANCLDVPESLDKDIMKRESKLNALRRLVLTDKSDAAEFVRVSLGLHYRQAGLGKKAMLGAFNQWISDVTHFNMNGISGIPTGKDLSKLKWGVDRAMRKYDGAMKAADKILQRKGIDGNINKAVAYARENGRLISLFRRAMPLTKEAHYNDKLPSEQLLKNILQLKQRADSRKLKDSANIKEIVLTLDKLANESVKKSSKKLSEIDGKIANYADRLTLLQQMKRDGKMTPKFTQEGATIRKDQKDLVIQRTIMLSDLNNHPASAIGSRIIKIVENTNETSRIIETTKLAKEAFVDPDMITTVVKGLKKIYKVYGDEIGPRTASNSRKVIDLHMERLGFSEADRAELIEKLTFEQIDDGFFPRIARATQDAIVLGDLANQLEAQANGQVDERFGKDRINLIASKHAKQRKSKGEIAGRNRDLIDVTMQYTQQMAHSDYVAGISLEIEQAINTLWDLSRSSQDGRFEVYLELFKNEVEILRKDAVATTDHGIMASLSRSSHALFAAGMLGAMNLSGMVRNVVEGHIYIGAKAGVTAWKRGEEIYEQNKSVIAGHNAGERIDFASDELWRTMVDSPDLRQRIIDRFGEDMAYSAFNVVKDSKSFGEYLASQLEKGTGALANKLMSMGWTPIENIPRRRAHKIGSGIGFQDAQDRILPSFHTNTVSQALINRYDLDAKAVRSGDMAQWEPEYLKVEKDMTTRSGFEWVAKTQWIYDGILRHSLEGWTPGGAQIGKHAAMFMHYGFSANTARYFALQSMFGRVRAGGLVDGLGGTTEEREYAYEGKFTGGKKFSFNRDLAFMSTITALGLIGMVIKDEEFGKWSGLRVYGFMNDDIMNMQKDFFDFFAGNPDAKKKAFFGKGIISAVGGPPVGMMIDGLNTAAVDMGMSFENFPDELQDGLRFMDAHPDDYKLEEGHTRRQDGIDYLRRIVPGINKGIPIIEDWGDFRATTENAVRFLFSISPHYNPDKDDEFTPEEERQRRIDKDWKRAVEDGQDQQSR